MLALAELHQALSTDTIVGDAVTWECEVAGMAMRWTRSRHGRWEKVIPRVSLWRQSPSESATRKCFNETNGTCLIWAASGDMMKTKTAIRYYGSMTLSTAVQFRKNPIDKHLSMSGTRTSIETTRPATCEPSSNARSQPASARCICRKAGDQPTTPSTIIKKIEPPPPRMPK